MSNWRPLHYLRVLLVPLGAWAAGGQTNPPAPASIDPVSYQRLVDENVDLRKDQARLIRESNDLRRRNASLMLQVQELQRKQEALSSALAGMQSPDELRAELERGRRALDALTRERDTLSREVDRIRSESGSGGNATTPESGGRTSPAAGSDLFRKLERENADLRNQLEKAHQAGQSESQARQAADRRESRLQAEVDETKAELSGAKREADLAAAREKALRTALVRVAKKMQSYETLLRAAEAKAAATNVVTLVPHARNLEPSLLDAARKSVAAGHYADAERLYLAGIARDPRNPQLHYNLGVLYDDYLQDPRRAAACYRKYLELNPAASDASIVRSWLLELDIKGR